MTLALRAYPALRTAALAALGLVALLAPATAGAQPADLPIAPATTDQYPPGVRVAETPGGAVYTDAAGHVLYGMDTRVLLRAGPDPSQYCTGACLERWAPLLAPAGSTPDVAFPIGNHDHGGKENPGSAAASAGKPAAAPDVLYADPQKAPDWTVIAGPQGPQWVYKGWHMVFTRRGAAPGSVADDGAEAMTWNTLKFVPPVPTVSGPQGVKPVFVGGAYVLADPDGRVLFSGRCRDDCAHWRPMAGGMAAAPVGAWRVDTALDTPQWTYRGEPVFVSDDDDPTHAPAGAALLHP